MSPLLFAVIVSSAAFAADFSHELHMKMVPLCTGCHAFATTSTQATDNLLPPAQICAKCHEQATIKAPRATTVARFNHSKHVKIGPTIAPALAQAIDRKEYLSQPDPDLRRQLANAKGECTGCHRGLDESKAVNAASVSPHMPHMSDCLVCHNKIDPPETCATCHSPVSMQLRPANHSRDFLDRHTSGKIGLDLKTCSGCHGRTFSCMGCH